MSSLVRRPLPGIIATAYVVFIGYLMLMNRDPEMGLSWYLVAIPFFAWVIGPQVLLYGMGWRHRNDQAKEFFAFLLQVLCVLFSGYVYIDAFFYSLRSTSALVFIWIPLYQYLLIMVMNGIIYLSGLRKQKGIDDE